MIMRMFLMRGGIMGAVLLGALFFVAGDAYAGEPFFLDATFDVRGRQSTTATLYYEGNRAEYYVEDPYLETLGGFAQNRLRENIAELSAVFDTKIYHNLTRTFGLPWTPGIDNNLKTTVLLVQTKSGIGGYFTDLNEASRSVIATSNEREMVYINVSALSEGDNIQRAAGFLAHEFQHLINYNQKTRRGTVDELWFNEMLSEVAPTIAGLDDIYAGSNMEARVKRFLQDPDDVLTMWGNKSEDYASVNVFGQYLLGQYGNNFFTLVSQSSKTGIAAIDEALLLLGKSERFPDVFLNWAIASLLNDCSLGSVQTYCYKNPNLSGDTLRINFNVGLEEGDTISSVDRAFPWQGQWFKYERTAQSIQPDNDVFILDFASETSAAFAVPYVVYRAGLPELFTLRLDENGQGTIVLDGFGFDVTSLVLMPLNQTRNTDAAASFSMIARLSKEAPVEAEKPTTMPSRTGIADGSLIRAVSDNKVYVVGGAYKRWIQVPDIIDFYGHLRWEDVVEVSRDLLQSYRDSNVIRFIGDPRVYQTTAQGAKKWIETEQEFLSLGYSFDMVFEVNEREFDFYR